MKHSLTYAAIVAALSSATPLALAQDVGYDDIKTGTLSGKLLVQWLEPDLFRFIPDRTNPLSFTRASGQRISPEKMITDGGSIPRPMWILRSYSPWGFAPAYIVHDWLFEIKHCQYAGYDKLTLNDTALVMAEIMKTMIEKKKIDASSFTVIGMYLAVTSSIALKHWNEGKCSPPEPALFEPKPLHQFTLSF